MNELDKENLKTVAIYLAAAANACAKFEDQPEAIHELRLLAFHYSKQAVSGDTQ